MSLIFMRIYDVTDFPGVSQQYLKSKTGACISNTLHSRTCKQSTQLINIHEDIQGHGFPWGFLTIFKKNEWLLVDQILQIRRQYLINRIELSDLLAV